LSQKIRSLKNLGETSAIQWLSNGCLRWQLDSETAMKMKTLIIGTIAVTAALAGGWALAQSVGQGASGFGPPFMRGHGQDGMGPRMMKGMRHGMGPGMMHGMDHGMGPGMKEGMGPGMMKGMGPGQRGSDHEDDTGGR
jgi:hypothetical protein